MTRDNSSHHQITQLLLEEIKEKGISSDQVMPSIPFSHLMETALYHPKYGYYYGKKRAIGKKGDFFTNVSIGKSYGILLSFCFIDAWQQLGSPSSFYLVEQGAHDASLAYDILSFCHRMAETATPSATSEKDNEYASFINSLRYLIIEPHSRLRQEQEKKLAPFMNSVEWISGVSGLEKFPTMEGVFFCNELLDAFPCDLLNWDGIQWQEKRVTLSTNQEITWQLSPIKDRRIAEKVATFPRNLPAPFQIEIIPEVLPWLDKIRKAFHRGILLIADYGMTNEERFLPFRASGTIACYYQHQHSSNPLLHLGTQDITSHINFSDLVDEATQTQWELLGYSDQHHFLIPLIEKWMPLWESIAPASPHDRRAIQTLLHPESMGRSFQFLGLSTEKNIELNAFRYQSPGVNIFD